MEDLLQSLAAKGCNFQALAKKIASGSLTNGTDAYGVGDFGGVNNFMFWMMYEPSEDSICIFIYPKNGRDLCSAQAYITGRLEGLIPDKYYLTNSDEGVNIVPFDFI